MYSQKNDKGRKAKNKITKKIKGSMYKQTHGGCSNVYVYSHKNYKEKNLNKIIREIIKNMYRESVVAAIVYILKNNADKEFCFH